MNYPTISEIWLSYPAPAIRASRNTSPRCKQIAQWFGLPVEDSRTGSNLPLIDQTQLRDLFPSPGQIVFISGGSGAGKSSLLNAIVSHKPQTRRVIGLNQFDPPDVEGRAVIDCFDSQIPIKDVLLALSRVGLAEAWTYLRLPRELSQGQQWRLRMAMALLNRRDDNDNDNDDDDDDDDQHQYSTIVADEFAAVLDRVTAAVVARALRRSIDANPRLSAIVATSHDDLVAALAPDVQVQCDFGSVRIVRRDFAGKINAGRIPQSSWSR